jgi:coenzyme F420-0:L-glutamate ligase/coenzyme F420-1:gamma-L-glutamate ligase
MSATADLHGFLVRGVPAIKEGDNLAFLVESLFPLLKGDVLCLASTVVSKSEGRARDLGEYQPSSRAMELAGRLDKDPRFVQAVLEESEDVLLERPFLLVATKFGHICVNAGIDQSNVEKGKILLLPKDPSASAERIRGRLQRDCAVIITDSCGRSFRCGICGVAVGWSGIGALRDWRGVKDLHGRPLEITQESIVDELAGAANLLMGEAGDGTPAVVFRGLDYPKSGGNLFRPQSQDVIRVRLKD